MISLINRIPEKQRRIGTYAFLVFVLALITECFIYNFRYWESLTFKKPAEYQIHLSGIEDIDGYFYRVTNKNNAYFEITDINAPVKNIFFDPFGDSDGLMDSFPISVSITDEANALYKKLPDTEVVNGIWESLYIRIFTSGNSEKIRIYLRINEGTKFGFSGLELNKVRPFLFHTWRFGLFLVLYTLIAVFRPGAMIYQIPIDLSCKKQKMILALMLCANALLLVLIVLVFRNKGWNWEGLKNQLQYNYLTESLLHGHTWLEFDPPKSLASMDNPYDTSLRNKVLSEAGESSILDFAYYNGKYYSYFGIIPVLLFYLPFYVITGKQLETAMLLLVAGVAFTCASFWLVYTIIKKYFPLVSLGVFLLLGSLFIAGSEITYCVQVPTLYSVPIMIGVLLDIIGITCWLNAVDENGAVNIKLLTAGSLCIALVIGCRPPLAIAVLFAFPIFWQQFKSGWFFTKGGIKYSICALIPFLVVGSGIMYYNFIRFDNPLDFGATYNLTGFDMTHRGFIAERFIIGIFEYLFQPLRVNPKFPYFEVMAAQVKISTDYQGHLNNEPYMGGFFAFNTIGLILFNLRAYKKRLKEKSLWIFVLMSVLFGIIIMSVDIQMVGIVLRYLADFSIFLMIPVIILLLTALESNPGSEKSNTVLLLTILLSAFCIAVNYLSLIAAGRRNEFLAHPAYYYRAKYLLFSIFSIR